MSALVLLAGAAAFHIGTSGPEHALAARFDHQKWVATSSYLVLGCAVTLLLYRLCDVLGQWGWVQRWWDAPLRYLSDHLLEATVFHYLLVRILLDERIGLSRVEDGVRFLSWPSLVLACAALFVSLIGGLQLLDLVQKAIARYGGRRWKRVAVIAVVLLALVDVGHRGQYADPLTLRWCTFAVMLWLALYMRAARAPRAEQHPPTTRISPLQQ
jgi:hypothetical protein